MKQQPSRAAELVVENQDVSLYHCFRYMWQVHKQIFAILTSANLCFGVVVGGGGGWAAPARPTSPQHFYIPSAHSI
jgi:hypothetical protein